MGQHFTRRTSVCTVVIMLPGVAQQVLRPVAPPEFGQKARLPSSGPAPSAPQLAIVVFVAADVPTLPFASRAMAVMVTGPLAALVVSHCRVYGDVVTSPSTVVKFAMNRTLDTAIVSCTVAVKATVPVRLPAGTVNVTTGAAPRVGGEAPRSIRPYTPLTSSFVPAARNKVL